MKNRTKSIFQLCALFLILASAISAQNFKPAIESVSPEGELTPDEIRAWRADLKYIADELPAKHRELFARLDRGKFEDAVKKLEAGIPQMTEQRIVLEMARIVGLARDGHTWLRTIWEPKLNFQFLPFRTYVFEDGVYVISTSPEYKDLIGSRVHKVEGLAVKDAIAKVGEYTSTDNEFGIIEDAPLFIASPQVLYALGIAEDTKSLSYQLEKDGKVFTANVKLLEGADNSIQAMRAAAAGWPTVRDKSVNPTPLTLKYPEKRFWYEYVEGEKLLFVQLNAVLNGEDKTLEEFFSEVFEFSEKTDVDKFVLDLRYNGGGNNTLIKPIIRGLIQQKKIGRDGHLFVLIGRRTFSAAQNLVNQLENWTNAVFVGEPTGSHVNMYGDARKFSLPNSKLDLYISELYWQNKHARDRRRYTAPKIAAPPIFAAYKDNIDPVMKAIAEYRSKPTMRELAEKHAATLNVAGFRQDAIAFKNDPANKYIDIEDFINDLGYQVLNTKRFDLAVELFKINVEFYPESFNVYDSLAEAYANAEQLDLAIKFYKKSLELNPENTNAVQMIEKINSGSGYRTIPND